MIRTLALVVLFSTANAASAAFVVIDSFNNPAPATGFTIAGVGSTTLPPVATGEGSTRSTTLSVVSGVGSNSLTGSIGFDGGAGDGRLNFNTNPVSVANGVLTYSSFTGNSGNFFATGLPVSLSLNFLVVDPGVIAGTSTPAPDIPADIAISTTGGTLTGSLVLVSSLVPRNYQIPFDTLAGFGDLSQVLSITIGLNRGVNQRQATDLVLTSITLEDNAAPLPPTAFLALAAVPLLARLRRRS